jgi:DNA-directed RNA polymerase specialized sigma24 family protein
MPLVEDVAQLPAATTQPAARMTQSALLTQLDRKLRSAPGVIGERDRAFFWLYYRQGFTAEEIAGLAATGLTAKGVESALRRVTIWLRGEVERENPAEQIESG